VNTAHCHTCGQLREFRHLHDRPHGIPGTHMAGSERFECTVCGETYTVGDGAPFPLNFILDTPPDPAPIGAVITDERLEQIAAADVKEANEGRRRLQMSPHSPRGTHAMMEAREAALRATVQLLARHGYSVIFTGQAAGGPATIAEG